MNDPLLSGGEPEQLLDDEELTQYGREGTTPEFRDAPRDDTESDVSMLRGRWSGMDAGSIVRKRWKPDGRDQARHTTVGRLRELGFEVAHTPTRRNQAHVSVRVPGGKVPWDDAERDAFVKAFDPLPGGAQ